MTKNIYPWTRLQSEPIWDLACARYKQMGLPFHSMENHIHALYEGRLDDESRSAQWLVHNITPPPHSALSHIMRTARHMPGGDDRMALLDLTNFAFREERQRGTSLLRAEAAQNGVSGDDFNVRTISYLTKLRDGIEHGLLHGPRSENSGWWLLISSGINSTLTGLRAGELSPEMGYHN